MAVERRRRYLMAKFPIKQMRVLELGAMDMPTFELSETAIEFMDYYSDSEFLEMAAQGKLSRPAQNLVSVKHVVKTKFFAAQIPDRYDLILAAHVIEHVPDPLAWLAELASLLTPNGSIFLAVPDKRYTLDYLRHETTPIDLLRCFDQRAEEPDLYQIADFLYYKRSVRWTDVWTQPEILPDILAKRECTLPQAMSRASTIAVSGLSHVNVHCHVFSAPTFADVYRGMVETGIIPLDLDDVVDVQPNGNEFWTLLKQKQVVDPSKRRPTKGRKFTEGKNGFLFLDNDTNGTIAQITGEAPLSASALGQWRRLISARRHLVSELGATYTFSIAPAKEAVLSCELPSEILLSDNRPAVQIARLPTLAHTVKYPVEELRELYHRGILPYPRGETHWTDAGALTVYRALLHDLSSDDGFTLLDEADFERHEDRIAGDLAVHAGHPPETVPTLTLRTQRHTTVYHNRRVNRGLQIITENKAAPAGKAMVFGDSFFVKLLPLFAETFSRMTFTWNPFIDFDAVEEELPHYVFNIMAERFVPIAPDDNHRFSWEEIETLKKVRN